MYKPINNFNDTKSLACSLAEAGKIPADKLLCCSKKDSSCIVDPNCFGDEYEVAQCHNITTSNVCRRTDELALRACDWEGNLLYCLSAGASRKSDEYSRFPDAIKWMINRNNNMEESYNTTACDNGSGYQKCDSGGDLLCDDLFDKDYNCTWNNFTTGAKINRRPVGQLCEVSPPPPPPPCPLPTVGLATGIPLGILLIAATVLAFYYRQKYKGAMRFK